jgi:hypothetical protein
MLITFDESGRIEFTRNPTLLGLFPDDQKRIERMTDIQFDLLGQFYYIKFLRGPWKGVLLKWRYADSYSYDEIMRHWYMFYNEHSPALAHDLAGEYRGRGSKKSNVVQFATYEDAVKIEVAFIDYLREQGYSFA